MSLRWWSLANGLVFFPGYAGRAALGVWIVVDVAQRWRAVGLHRRIGLLLLLVDVSRRWTSHSRSLPRHPSLVRSHRPRRLPSPF